MIEIVSADRCTGCNICVRVCPTNVFEAVANAAPRIARQSDCQTCFMCELYCPEDALFVAAEADGPSDMTEAAPATQALLGSYRSAIGWKRGQRPTAGLDGSFELLERVH
ncbi:NAD-dependent dihydropyrimidine dehydrogenase, PreA subunit [Noviherbaspirillum humi]|uniref:NAD-dependent dihydropyrimidine dehydrogenase, PreA subunit n=1 Tax=Noviherbaspirillum humi TaxID=1688639 RepID=A0A239G3Y2_9BURK|nr:ferredoxin family protein [Noviherbaspirillum humi]SNS63810.1 NAD-dependent dihydropyrimidine dehydrogenase, PreA subunit [Noviherbaspirillum humi]